MMISLLILSLAATPAVVAEDFVDVSVGNMPLVLSAPHGGTDKPVGVPDRTEGTLVRDSNTLELAIELAASIEKRTGKKPFLVTNRMHRVKMDPNRAIEEATQGGVFAAMVYRAYHKALEESCQQALQIGGGDALLIDLHGHAHPDDWIEVGHLLTGSELAVPDDELENVDWIRGPRSIGALLEKAGFQAVPSPRLPHPDGKKYWSGGYITRHYRKDGMRTLQFEHPWSVRKKEGRVTSVPALAEAIDELMMQWKIGHKDGRAQKTAPEKARTENPRSTRPNVIIVMTDDQGYGDLGFNGNPVIKTPNLDAMARESARLEPFYVCPVCTPTRASLMTGRSHQRTRAIDTYIGRAMMDPSEVTIAEILRDAGYATGIFGKWHLGDCYPMRPGDQGFEKSLIHRGGGIGQPSDPVGGERKYTDPILIDNGIPRQMKGYCTDIYFDEALKFAARSHKKDKPFLAVITDNCPHGPWHDVPAEELALYEGVDLSADAFPQDEGAPLKGKWNQDQVRRSYAMITNIDENMGKMIEKIDAMGIGEETLIIFFCDNGPEGRRFVSGYRGSKSSTLEGGVRSPFFARWPGTLITGAVTGTPAAVYDVLPTVLAACSVPVPQGLEIDGTSFLLEMKGAKVKRKPRTVVIQAHRGDQPVRYHNFMVRARNWKLVHPSAFWNDTFEGEPDFQLYNMERDPYELEDVSESNPQIVQRLLTHYEKWFEDVSAEREDPWAPPRIVIGTEHEKKTVLTRQDWRHTHGRPWARDSRGQWHVTIADEGPYQIDCRFAPRAEPGVVTLVCGDLVIAQSLLPTTRNCRFGEVVLPEGDVELEIHITHGEQIRGIRQADIQKISSE
ncbi:MAG: sulfatase-like hydrolase/transferase [Planctomycetota bacterium]|nr:sulfatase-like hydrolase/transferase [Planctomycetota bacterium]